MGYIGLSKGYTAYYPILVYNERSFGGGAISDNCIIKIKEAKGGHVLYQSANFQQPKITMVANDIDEALKTGYTHSVYIDGELYSNHKSEKSALNLKKKLS